VVAIGDEYLATRTHKSPQLLLLVEESQQRVTRGMAQNRLTTVDHRHLAAGELDQRAGRDSPQVFSVAHPGPHTGALVWGKKPRHRLPRLCHGTTRDVADPPSGRVGRRIQAHRHDRQRVAHDHQSRISSKSSSSEPSQNTGTHGVCQRASTRAPVLWP
jgi:hypothetical protein